MLDIKFIRQNPDKVKKACKDKQVKVDIDKLLELDKEMRELKKQIEELSRQRNIISTITEPPEFIQQKTKEGREVKSKIKEIGPQLKRIALEFNELMFQVPNPAFDNIPVGKDESENVVIKEVGKKTEFDFKLKDYLEIAENLYLIDVKRAAKTSGTRFGFLKNEAVFLELAMVNFLFDELKKEKFTPVIPPVLIRPEMMKGMGYVERGEDEIYHIEKDDLYLIGTSEQIIGPMHANETLSDKELPKKYVSFSSCFRREAGSYGKDTKGILRVHQFDKVEMLIFCRPENSIKEHEYLLSLEEKFMQALKLPYRVVQICTGDLGDPAASKYDIEAWIPSQNRYRETHSTSNCTDFQARRLKIRYKDKSNKMNFVHMLNGTALAIGRTIIAIIENYQQKDGSISIPKVLQKYTGFKKIQRK